MSVYSDKYHNFDIPVICTRGIIIFPTQEVSIEVGRDISINALNKAKVQGKVLIVSQVDANVELPQNEDIFDFGTLCEISSIHESKNAYKVKFLGLSRAKVNYFTLANNYYIANIDCVDDIYSQNNVEQDFVRKVLKEFEKSPMASNLPNKLIKTLSTSLTASQIADQFAQFLPMDVITREEILEQLNVTERLMLVLKQFEFAKQVKLIDDKIDRIVKDSIDDNQKEYILREKLKAVKEELNGYAANDEEQESLLEKFENNPYPEHIKKKAKEEINRLEMMPSISPEAAVISSYLDWLAKVPYWQVSTDNQDINEISRILDEDHYGLQKVKERILEYIAVKNFTGSLKAPILCLYGPPGVGKTSLAKSIARALNRSFVKISVGGVKDEAEIRGHRRTYLGSMPGRIIQGMKKAGTINPVFLIDELDKMGADYKSDPASAMLEVLDPEQNSLFSDNYLEETYDLSQVMFIATANDISTIPSALKDRLEIIEMQSYTEDEKLHIAVEHLLAKQIKENGLKRSQFKIDEESILYIIRYYTRESGVRQLERCFGKLCRKAVLTISKGEKKSITVNKKLINEYLGKEIYQYGKKETGGQVGTVTGLAYTAFGGDTLPIEVTTYPGKGKLVLTGNLGDVMKESATIALGYVKSNANKYHIENKFFENNDIQIHAPEGAVPKDGPSAGITLTTAIISAITNKKVSSDIAMTGEITLRGNVLPIGGLREKSMAAHRSNIHTVIIPQENMKDLDELDNCVKEDINFIPVKQMNEVYNNVFGTK